MQTTLAAMAADLHVRCDAIDDAIGASHQPELDFQRDSGRRVVTSVRAVAGPAASGTAQVQPAQYGPQLRRLQNISQLLDIVESRVLPCVERFGPVDEQQTAILRALLAEAGWTRWVPAVLTWSSRYFSAMSALRVISVPAGEQARLLRIPDLCHEFGHCLYSAHGDDLTRPLLGDLLLWASSVSNPTEASARDRIVTLWSDAWLAELTCDGVGTFLTGPAFARQHLMLTARVHSDPYRASASHPADHARAALIAGVLRKLTLEDDADRFWARWKELCGALEQPVVDPNLGQSAVRPASFWEAYPTNAQGRHFIDRVAEMTVDGCHRLGMTPCGGGLDPATSIRGMLANAWDRYEQEPGEYGRNEASLVADLLKLV